MRVGIIGGGPGGSVAGAMLSRAGHDVHIFEAVPFPRFHIGESLLPCNLPVYEDLGLDRAIFARHGFVAKMAAHFEQVGTGQTVRFPFSDGLPGDPPSIFQVERATFDHMLLSRAVALGAVLHSPVVVDEVVLTDRPRIRAADGEIDVDVVIDASGRETLIGRQLGLIDREGDLMRAAVYGHVAHLPLAPGAEPGDIVISKCRDGWAWQIPIRVDRWSVGLVLKREVFSKAATPAEAFRANLAHFPEFQQRLGNQVPEPVRATSNISYRVRQRHGRRWALVGDAGGFVDPVFSSGVLLATRSAWTLARRLIADGPDADLSSWGEAAAHDLTAFTSFIRLWYDGHFIDNLFFSPVRESGIYHGIISMLAGNTTDPGNPFLSMLMQRARHPVSSSRAL